MNIHPTAIVDASATLAADVRVGPYAIIGPNVTLGPGCVVESHARLACNTTMGRDNHIHAFASIGGDHQSQLDDGEPTYLEVGDGNAFHEYCTINRGSSKDRSVTRIGHRNIFMAYTHVAHDCMVDDETILVNHATLGGHVHLRSQARVGAFCAVHQFCEVGELAFLTRGCLVSKDVLPYVIVQNNPPSVVGLNKVGLQRSGKTDAEMKCLSEAYRTVFRRGLPAQEGLAQLKAMDDPSGVLAPMVRSLESSTRGIER